MPHFGKNTYFLSFSRITFDFWAFLFFWPAWKIITLSFLLLLGYGKKLNFLLRRFPVFYTRLNNLISISRFFSWKLVKPLPHLFFVIWQMICCPSVVPIFSFFIIDPCRSVNPWCSYGRCRRSGASGIWGKDGKQIYFSADTFNLIWKKFFMVSFCPQQTGREMPKKTSFPHKIFINILISLCKLQYLPDHCLPRVCQYGDEQRPVGGVHHRQSGDGDDHGVARAQHQTGGLLGAGGVRAQVRGPRGI